MSKTLQTDLARLLIRVFFGFSMAMAHGYGKIVKYFSGGEIQFLDPIGLGASTSLLLAGVSEFAFPLLVAVGLFTRLSCLPVMATMVVAFAAVHLNDPYGKQELALVYLVAFTAIFLMGPGRFSADSIFRKKN
jgi:putative oxidoreductase